MMGDENKTINCGYCGKILPYDSFQKSLYAHLEEECLPYWKDKYKNRENWNSGDWTTLDTVEIGDIVGSRYIDNVIARDLIRDLGEKLQEIYDGNP